MRIEQNGVRLVVPDDEAHYKDATIEQLFNQVGMGIDYLLRSLFGNITGTHRVYDLSPGELHHLREKELLKMWAVQGAVWELRRRLL